MKYRMRIFALIFLFCTYFTVINFIPPICATATDYEASYRSGALPTIDGTISSSEWSNITPYELTFQYNVTGNSTITVELFLLHDGTALFIGLNMTVLDNGSDPTDAFFIYFDENHDEECDGETTDPKEEGLMLRRDGNYTDLSFNGSEWIDDESVNDTKGPGIGATNMVGQWEFKFISTYNPTTRKSYNSSDFDVDLPSYTIERAAEFGFNIEYYDADLNRTDSCTTATNGTERVNATHWDDLICAALPEATPNLTAIWTFIIIAMIIPLGIVLYLYVWMIRKKKTY